MSTTPNIAALYLRWIWLRAVLHRGWWLATSLYLVVVADLSAPELIFYGIATSLTQLLAEVPTGVFADTVSRKWSLVLAHGVMGTGMVLTGMVTTFEWLLVAQVFWGLGWTFSSGADVAWVTDELRQPGRIDRVLAAQGRWESVGAACGLVGFGALAWVAGLGTAVVTAGLAMVGLGLLVALAFPEHRFTQVHSQRWTASTRTLRRGVALARNDREILAVFAATLLVNGAAAGYGFLYPRHLLDLGLPTEPDPILWFTGLGLAMLALAVAVLRVVEARIEGAGAARRDLMLACLAGGVGVAVLAAAPEDVTAMAGLLLVRGVSEPVTRTVATIWVNRRTSSDVRATVHSFLTQAETLGEILLGLALALLAAAGGIRLTFAVAAVLFLLAAAAVARVREGSATAPP